MEQVEVCNSWEEFDDNSKLLEQHLEKLKLEKSRHPTTEVESLSPSSESVVEGPPKMRVLKRNPTNNNSEATSNGTPACTNDVIEVREEDSMRTQYVPPEPRISILSRPKKKTTEELQANSNPTKGKNQAVKTLEQREQEYAEARKRIFGDELETPTTTT